MFASLKNAWCYVSKMRSSTLAFLGVLSDTHRGSSKTICQNMKKLTTAIFTLLILTVCGFAQASAKTEASLDAAMRKFIGSVGTKNTAVFLSFISPAKGLIVMNTIDQNAGNADNPVLDAKLSYKTLAADFKRKRGTYRDIFVPSPDSPNFYDAFANRKQKWSLGDGNKFMLIDEDGKPSNLRYVKWVKEGNRWIVTEVGRQIS